MKVIALLLLFAIGAVLARRLYDTDNPRRRRRQRFAKPGEGMRRHDPGLPTLGLVTVATLSGEEATVARGLLESAGIPAYTEGIGIGARVYHTLPSQMRVVVPPERVDEARAVLRSAGT